MDKNLLIRLGLTALLILAYVISAALDIARETVAPVIVIAIALILFVPLGKKKDNHKH